MSQADRKAARGRSYTGTGLKVSLMGMVRMKRKTCLALGHVWPELPGGGDRSPVCARCGKVNLRRFKRQEVDRRVAARAQTALTQEEIQALG